MGIASSFLLPTVVRYILPALLLLLLARPWLPSLGNMEAAGLLLLFAFGLTPILEAISEGLAAVDPRFSTLTRVATWYWHNWDVTRMFTLATKEERERAEYEYAFVKFYNMSAVLLFIYGVSILVYGLLSAASTPTGFFEISVPFLAAGWTKPAWLVGGMAVVLAFFIHTYFLDRYLAYYRRQLLQLATVAEAKYGKIARTICGELQLVDNIRSSPTGTAAQERRAGDKEGGSQGWLEAWRTAFTNLLAGTRSTITKVERAFSRPFIAPMPSPLQIANLSFADAETILTERLKVIVSHPHLLEETRICNVDVYGRYSIRDVPYSEQDYLLKLVYQDRDGNFLRTLCTWSQRHGARESEYLKKVSVQASLLRALWEESTNETRNYGTGLQG